MNQQSEHLSDAEVEQYGLTGSSTEPEAAVRRDRIEEHLADCSACSERVLASQRVRLALLAASPVTPAQGADRRNPGRPGSGTDVVSQPSADRRTPDCPDEDDLRHLAAGLFPPEQSAKLTQHAAECDHCGPLLRTFVEDFSEELSSDDQAVLAKAKSSSAGWQKKLAREMVSGPDTASAQSAKNPFPWRWVLAPAALAACGLIVFGIWYSQRETPEKVEKLLAQAYTEQRPMEMRWPGAKWGPVRIMRGAEGSAKPESLLKGKLIISKRQQANDIDDVNWLRAKGETELLGDPPEVAITTLSRALEIQPGSDPIMLDLSIAYAEQQNYPKAIDLLTKITDGDPNNKEAWFNLALAYGSAEKQDMAIAAWEEYLKLDPDGPWANEAKHLRDIAKSKLRSDKSLHSSRPLS